ncbi:MAG TPA: TRAP transporter substrate-binding protein DctP [Pseudolabrys sp.]|nr:TRAP transporter substrate-binding protein DctP [Pseudolabrys sp.]
MTASTSLSDPHAINRHTIVAAVLLVLGANAACAEPIELKLSFFASEQTNIYAAGVKPFVDGVNADGKGLIEIKVYDDAALGPLPEQPRLVHDGAADIAWIVPGQTPYRFPDNELLEMPGLFRDLREATQVYTNLVSANALRGYQDFFVIGAYTGDPGIVHSRKPIGSLAALAGQKIRANNPMEADALDRLGATPTVMPASKIAGAISSGAIDGAVMAPAALFDFGVASVAHNHYLLRGGAAPIVLVMSRKKFDSLPKAAKDIVRKYSGERSAAAWIASYGASESAMFHRIQTTPGDTVVRPSPADRIAAQHVYRSLIESWAARSAHNRELLRRVDAELAIIRSDK